MCDLAPMDASELYAPATETLDDPPECSTSAGLSTDPGVADMNATPTSPPAPRTAHVDAAGVKRLLSGAEQEVHTNMRAKELDRRPTFDLNAKYSQHRRRIVDWMIGAAQQLRLEALTIHAAVNYLDIILNRTFCSTDAYQLLAMACTFLAAKVHEQDRNVPEFNALNRTAGGEFALERLERMERHCLKVLKWELYHQTTSDFLDVYLRFCLFKTDTRGGRIIPSLTDCYQYLVRYADFFSEAALLDYAFVAYNPSLVACSMIACARRALRIEPIWPRTLETLTEYDAADLAECNARLWAVHREYAQSGDAALYDAADETPVDVRDADSVFDDNQ